MVMLFCLWCAFTATQPSEQPEGTPLFITDIAPCKDGMIVSQKGIRKVTLYAPDYKERLQEWALDEVPTGVAVDGDQVVTTVAGELKNGVYLLSLSQPSVQDFIPTASGACAPLVDAQSGRLYVCNQFAGTVSYSGLYGHIDRLDCVAGIRSLVLDAKGNGVRRDSYGDLIFPGNGIADEVEINCSCSVRE